MNLHKQCAQSGDINGKLVEILLRLRICGILFFELFSTEKIYDSRTINFHRAPHCDLWSTPWTNSWRRPETLINTLNYNSHRASKRPPTNLPEWHQTHSIGSISNAVRSLTILHFLTIRIIFLEIRNETTKNIVHYYLFVIEINKKRKYFANFKKLST